MDYGDEDAGKRRRQQADYDNEGDESDEYDDEESFSDQEREGSDSESERSYSDMDESQNNGVQQTEEYNESVDESHANIYKNREIE